MSVDLGITVKKSEDMSEWYSQVVLKAELADYAPMKGFIVLRPYGYSIWETIEDVLDSMFKDIGVKNAYFPTLIPERLLSLEAEHFKGFTPETFWVTHAGDEKLSERLAARPTSETIAYHLYAKWIRSWRDLPLLLNFWNSVLRAEIKSTKPFIRTSEFLWQEGHTAHESKEDADRHVLRILKIYQDFIENWLAVPVLAGTKTDKDKFLGALYTTTLEAIMPDGKALQMGTSHNLGQNFSKPFEIRFLGRDELEHFAWQTSWGVSWRMIGALIMVHGDDDGLILPPKIAPTQIIIVPISYGDEEKIKVLEKVKEVMTTLRRVGLRVDVDDREAYTPGWKFNDWELKGVPLRMEIGPRDLKKHSVVLVRRDTGEKTFVEEEKIVERVQILLTSIQQTLYERAHKLLENMTSKVQSYEEFRNLVEGRGGFIKACWCGNDDCETLIKEETGADIRLMPLENEEVFSGCIKCEREGKKVVYFARAY